jgi:SAM-dependent methyltransferase
MARDNEILSPITNKDKCKLLVQLDTNKIVAQYREESHTDVTRFFKDNQLGLYECPVTGYRFYHPPSSMGDGLFYEELESLSKGSYYPQKKWEYLRAAEFVTADNSVLEIGCGNGAFIRLCKEKGVQHITGLELNEKVVKEMQQQGIDARNVSIEDHAAQGHKYSVVCSFQVLEHVYDVHSFLSAALACVEKNGLLIIGVPNSNPYMFKGDLYNTLNMPPHHIGLWNKDSLEKTAKYFDLEVLFIKVAPFEGYKNWFLYHRKRLIEKSSIYSVLKIIPRPIYKLMVRAFASQIEGSTILTVFKKR